MDISEVESILSHYRFLDPPEHLLLTQEPVSMKTNGDVIFLGLGLHAKSVVVLTPQATPETVPHELAHTHGFGQLVAYPFGRIAIKKLKFTEKFPLLDSFLTREVEYEFRDDLPKKFKGKTRHYVKRRF